MARAAKAVKTKQPPAGTGQPDRAKSSVAAASPKTAKLPITSKRVPAAAPVAAKLSKDELRAQVQNLESVTATLRGKNREANKAAKAAATRMSGLQQQVAQLEKKVAPAIIPAKSSVKPAKATSAKR